MGQDSLETLLAEQQELAQKMIELRTSLTKEIKEDQDCKIILGEILNLWTAFKTKNAILESYKAHEAIKDDPYFAQDKYGNIEHSTRTIQDILLLYQCNCVKEIERIYTIK
jgi:coenzyme F420-reducing hydrogenase alpha subunit